MKHMNKESVDKWYKGNLSKMIFIPLLVIAGGMLIHSYVTKDVTAIKAGWMFLGGSAFLTVSGYFIDVWRANKNEEIAKSK